MLTFRLHFLLDLRKITTFNFPEVVKQQSEGVVGNIKITCYA